MSSWDRFLAEWLSLPLVGDINQWALDHPVEVGTVAVFITVLLSLLLLGTLARSFSGAAENKSAAKSLVAAAAKNNALSSPNHQGQAHLGDAPEQPGAKAVASAGHATNFETFEKHLALSSDVLSEVGLAPIPRTAAHSLLQATDSSQSSPSNRYHEFLDSLSVEELLLVVRYSLLRESGEDAREAVKRISQRGTAEQRRLALSLMEEA